MKEIITGSFAKKLDEYAIRERGIPSLTLMEAAAGHVFEHAKNAIFRMSAAETAAGVLKEETTGQNVPKKDAAETEAGSRAFFNVLIFCGVGNNGADGLSAGAMLCAEGFRKVRAVCCGKQEKASEEFLVQKERFLKAGGSFCTFPVYREEEEKREARASASENMRAEAMQTEDAAQGISRKTNCAGPHLIIDALFGIGLKRAVTGEYAEAIEAMNLIRNRCRSYVIAVDIPSGIDADCGRNMCAPLYPVHADETVTFGYAKTGHYLDYGYGRCGEIFVYDIGYPKDALSVLSERERESGKIAAERSGPEPCKAKKEPLPDTPAAGREKTKTKEALAACPQIFTDTKEVFLSYREAFSERDRRANKGSYLKLLIAAGSAGMAGAAYLSGLAAYRSGIGMVKYLGPEKNRGILQTLLPEAMYEAYEPEAPDFAKRLKAQAAKCLSWADIVILGPGLSKEAPAVRLTEEILRGIADMRSGKTADGGRLDEKTERTEEKPAAFSAPYLIIDADALNILSERRELTALLDQNMVLTPHVGELARLSGRPIGEVKSHFSETAAETARRFGTNILAKDSVSLFVTKDEAFINLSGSAAMAKAGSGDVLTGVIAGAAAVCGQFPESAAAALYLHGRAGELSAEACGVHSTLASDLCGALGAAMKG